MQGRTYLFPYPLPMFCVLMAAATLNVDVAVVGGGQAGMAAAHSLKRRGYSVHVLEAADHVGGRTRNLDVATGKMDVASDEVFELGGTWLSPNHTRTLALAAELGIEIFNASFVPFVPSDQKGDAEWPWWFWGSYYSAAEQAGANATVFHGPAGPFQFHNQSELLSRLPADLIAELAATGDRITADAARAAQCWEAAVAAPSWAELDVQTTASALYPSVRSSIGRVVLANGEHRTSASPTRPSLLHPTPPCPGRLRALPCLLPPIAHSDQCPTRGQPFTTRMPRSHQRCRTSTTCSPSVGATRTGQTTRTACAAARRPHPDSHPTP